MTKHDCSKDGHGWFDDPENGMICVYCDMEYDVLKLIDRIEQLEAALREKDNIAYIIDSHGMTHECFTIIYREKKDG